MKKITKKEEEIMNYFWEKGPMFIKELKSCYKGDLHYNTLSTIVRGLEEKGFISHEQFGNTYRYYANVLKDEFEKSTLKNVIQKHFNNSYKNVVSLFVEERKLSIEDLKKIIEEIEDKKK